MKPISTHSHWTGDSPTLRLRHKVYAINNTQTWAPCHGALHADGVSWRNPGKLRQV